MTADPSPGDGRVAPEAELRHGAISFLDALVIGLASTSPAYSLAAIIGPIVALVGVHAPGVLLASFVPMLMIASAFYYLNKADQDCGTTFSWVTRALGPWFGWMRLGDRGDRRRDLEREPPARAAAGLGGAQAAAAVRPPGAVRARGLLTALRA
jgi:hypothetical protein